ncbi:hypothetical protein AWB76_03252 [Caballeronia temeraria]|uniref:Uncharacterized protein n=1 Tax=Caballeronia temeraria TaxID=1777137 RepID=A0A158AXH8_9BURK|nr:hypothetical protein [Caballeronia temeraria]SAK62475.1 hypothetical protein AWB76_03252 [Caballeronia temeraria]
MTIGYKQLRELAVALPDEIDSLRCNGAVTRRFARGARARGG